MKRILIAFTILASALCGARAGLVFSENFDYPDGGIVLNSAGIWVNNSGTAGTMLVSNNVLQVFTSRTEDVTHQLVPGYTNGGPVSQLYASMTVTFLSNSLPTLNGTYFTAFAAEAMTFYRCRVWAGSTNILLGNSAPPGSFYLGVGNNSPSTATPQGPTNGQLTSVLLTTNVTYTLVMRYAITNATSTIWVGTDPATMTESGTHATADDFVDPTNFTSINWVGFRQATGEGTILIDNLKVGTSFVDVAGANTSPTISPIPNQNIAMSSSTGPLPFTVGDTESSPGALTVSASSDNTNVVPNTATNIVVVSGDPHGACTINVIPKKGQQGAATITISVSDGVNTSTTTFIVTVGAPTINPIQTVIAYVNNTIAPVPLVVTDAENDPITFTAVSTFTNLIKSENIVISGSGPGYYISLTPQPGVAEWARIVIYASDGHSTNSTSFVLTVAPKLGQVFSDNFTYTEFDTPNSLYLAVGSPWDSASGTLYQMQVTNGFGVYLVSTNSEDMAASLTNNLGGAYPTPYYTSNAVVFYSALNVNFSESPAYSGDYFYHLKNSNSGTTFGDKVYGCTNGAAPGMFRLGVANFASAVSSIFPLDLSLNTTYTVVTRYNSTTGESVLWINPHSESSRCAAATDTVNSTTSIGSVGLRQSSNKNYGSLTLNSLRIATAWEELDLPTPPPLPSPIPLALGTIGDDVQLTWSDMAFVLQYAPTVTGPWINIPNAVSGYTAKASAAQTYYRLLAQ
jgi:hypothetical protein